MFDRTVNTKKGMVQGFYEDGMLKYKGIPYAKPPIGKLRFKRAVEADAWDGVLEADRIVDRSIQQNMTDGTHAEITGSEDCLYLNVIRPEEGENLPVLVWIHGGGYNTGGINDSLSHGEPFARDGVCYVEIQYRLNVLGFFDFTTYPNCEEFESNCGLSDQIMAIKWVHENIEAFGGNPKQVTICGESAGAASVTTLMAVPAVKGYFNQAIAESSLPNCVMTHEMARRNISLFLKGMGWTEKDIPKMLTMNPYEFLKGNQVLQEHSQEENPGIFLPGPVIDDLLPEWPIEAIARGSAKNVRLIIGTNLHEGTMFVFPEKTVFPNSWGMIEQMMAKNGYQHFYEKIRAYYDKADEVYPEITPFVHFATDYVFKEPAIEVANAQSRYNDVWVYSYELVSKAARDCGMLASHAFELAFVFEEYYGELPKATLGDEDPGMLKELAGQMHGSWVRFIKGEAPAAEWPKYEKAEADVRIFDKVTRTEKKDYKSLMELWEHMKLYH